MIYGYASRMSVYPGEKLELCVATTAPTFSVRIYRQGERFERMPDGTFEWFEGVAGDPKPAGEPFDWEPYDVRVPEHWKPGAYVAILVEGSSRRLPIGVADARTPDGREARVLFVVRSLPYADAPPILYKLPTFTYQAYNVPDPRYAQAERERRGDGDAQTLYTGSDVVSLHRNGGGTGGTPWDMFHAVDVYDPVTPRHTFAHWDAKFIAWLEGNGYGVECCTDLDLHERPVGALLRHRVIVSGGHDEYWSDDMRWHLERYVEEGGNAAFFAGNLLWWRVAVTNENRTIRRTGHFFDRAGARGEPVSDDETMLTGVTFAHGGGHWVGERPATGFTVRDPTHWAFAGTGLRAGDEFGAAGRLIGYECDGQPISWPELARTNEIVYDGSHRIPTGFELLAYADIRDWPRDASNGEALGSGAGIMGTYERGGTVFTAATTDWPRVLSEGDPHVERITRNVLDRLAGRPSDRLSVMVEKQIGKTGLA